MYHLSIPSPLGILSCVADETALLSIAYNPSNTPDNPNAILQTLRSQLDSYFNQSLQQFDIPVKLDGTDHQLRVWNALRGIPYGHTVTYAEIAKQVGSAPIAVGQAVGKNRVNIIIPCHRVVGSNGSLTGYGGGLERKRILLELEAK